MRFYQIEATVNEKETLKLNEGYFIGCERRRVVSQDSDQELNRHNYAHMTETYNEDIAEQGFVTACELNLKQAMFAVLDKDSLDVKYSLQSYCDKIHVVLDSFACEEITFGRFSKLLSQADRMDYIHDDDLVLSCFDLDDMNRPFASTAFEEFLCEPLSKKEAYGKACDLLADRHILEELDRIYEKAGSPDQLGHPVHYIIETNDKNTKDATFTIITSALQNQNRVANKRISELDYTYVDRVHQDWLRRFYEMNKGGIVNITFGEISDGESDRRTNRIAEVVEAVSFVASEFRNSVLTFFSLPRECKRIKKLLQDNLNKVCFIEIREACASKKRAKRFLKFLASKDDIEPDKKLFKKLDKDATYLTPELRIIYNDWLDHKVRHDVFPQYAMLATSEVEKAHEEAKGSAYQELMGLIGLADAKRVINEIIDFTKAQKYLEKQQMHRQTPPAHMIFTGNPGTAKTTVARLLAKVMRDNEVLSSGHLVEVGRADLVGQYVGSTAPRVKACFKEARGGILFIDEAYSLLDDREGLYGDEAINTIVQEMENNRDEVIVIFAGYPDKMEHFLDRNPGLRSRIAHHVHFPDYSIEELCDIAKLQVANKDMTLKDEALEYLLSIFEQACAQSDFGNGRFVRNIIDAACLAQASRLLKAGIETLKKSDLLELRAEDFKAFEPVKKSAGIPIGFCA